MIEYILFGLGISYVFLFLLSIVLGDNSIVDIFWGLGFIQVSIHSLFLSESFTLMKWILLIFVIIWALRLSGYVLSKRIKRGEEDPRYKHWRNTWKYFYLRSFFQVYVLQWLLLVIISLPLYFIFSALTQISELWFVIGLFIAIIGLLIESIADKELANFIKTKQKGDILESGLWKYSRHPNYFGESTIWLGISIIGSYYTLFSLLSYVTIFILLRFVSGVPMTENSMKENKNFREYMKKTNAFFPWFRKI